jgi:hypothetical protein
MLRQARLCSALLHQLALSRAAGHSKWANIKHIKAEKDAQKASIFSRFARMIRIGKNIEVFPKLDSFSCFRQPFKRETRQILR